MNWIIYGFNVFFFGGKPSKLRQRYYTWGECWKQSGMHCNTEYFKCTRHQTSPTASTNTHMVKLQMCCNNVALHACIRHPLHTDSLPDQFPDFPHVLSVPLTDSENRMTSFIFCILFESIQFMIYAAIILHVLHRGETWLCVVRDEHGECLVTIFEKMRIRCVAL